MVPWLFQLSRHFQGSKASWTSMDIAPCPAGHRRHGPSEKWRWLHGPIHKWILNQKLPASNSLGIGHSRWRGMYPTGISRGIIFHFWRKRKSFWKHRPVDWWGFGHLRTAKKHIASHHWGYPMPWPMPIWPFFGLRLIRALATHIVTVLRQK